MCVGEERSVPDGTVGTRSSLVTNYKASLTRATYILCIEHPRLMCLNWGSNPGPPALQANTLCKEPFQQDPDPYK
jgi:hypothetical protein